MSLKNKLLGFALVALTLAPCLARADEGFRGRNDRDDRGASGHRHDATCRHGASPVFAPTPRGHYETRVVQQWVEASFQQVWVGQTCRARPFRRPVCFPGYFEQQLVPGHYENVQQQVWVADFSRPDRFAYRTDEHAARPVTGRY